MRLDLLGFGPAAHSHLPAQDEPQLAGSVRYLLRFWATRCDFVASLEPNSARGPLQLGNSIGGLVPCGCQVLEKSRIAPTQVILIDCAQRTPQMRAHRKLPGL